MSEEEFSWSENIWWIPWSVFMILQIITGFLLYNREGFLAVFVVGWIVMIVGFLIGGMGVSTLRKRGGAPKGKKFSRFGVGTTTLVTSGIYAIVRHPQYLCWIFFNAAVILIAQNWVVAIIGFASMLSVYMQTRQDDQSLLKQFGDEYKHYMKKVPRMNFFIGHLTTITTKKKAISGSRFPLDA